jgi:hypothetical protein
MTYRRCVWLGIVSTGLGVSMLTAARAADSTDSSAPQVPVVARALLWSSDMRQPAALELVNRRLHKTPFGLLIALSGHPDYRNDLVLRVYTVGGREQLSVALKSNLTEQSLYDYWIEWK